MIIGIVDELNNHGFKFKCETRDGVAYFSDNNLTISFPKDVGKFHVEYNNQEWWFDYPLQVVDHILCRRYL